MRQGLQYSSGRHFNAVSLQTSKRQEQLTNKQTTTTTATTTVLCFISMLPLYNNNKVEIKSNKHSLCVCVGVFFLGFFVCFFLNEHGVRPVFCMPEGDNSTGFFYKQKQQNVCVCFYICAFFFLFFLYKYHGVTIKRQ